MAKRLLLIGTAAIGVLTVLGYLVMWQYLAPFGLERHIGDLPFQSYAGYGLSVLADPRSIPTGIVLLIMSVISFVRFMLPRGEKGYADICVFRGRPISPMRYYNELALTHDRGRFRARFLPGFQIGMLGILAIGLLLLALQYGSKMVDDATHGEGSGAALGVTIQRSELVDVNPQPLSVNSKYVSIWTDSDGTFFTPVKEAPEPSVTHSPIFSQRITGSVPKPPRRGEYSLRGAKASAVAGSGERAALDVLFVPKEQLRRLLEHRLFVGSCQDCTRTRGSGNPWWSLIGLGIALLIVWIGLRHVVTLASF
jgi:hypothetical protein